MKYKSLCWWNDSTFVPKQISKTLHWVEKSELFRLLSGNSLRLGWLMIRNQMNIKGQWFVLEIKWIFKKESRSIIIRGFNNMDDVDYIILRIPSIFGYINIGLYLSVVYLFFTLSLKLALSFYFILLHIFHGFFSFTK